MQPIHLIDSRPRIDLRAVFLGLLLGGAILMTALVFGGVMDLESQVLTLVMVDVLLITVFVAFYDLTNAIILWLFALTCISRYTQLNLPGIPDMSGPRFMLILMWAVFFVDVVLRRRQPLPLTRIEIVMLLLIAVHLASMVYHENLVHTTSQVSPITPFMNSVVFPFSIYYMARNVCSSDTATQKLWKALAVLQVYLVFTGIFEHFRIKWLVFPPDILDPIAGEGRWYGVRVRGPYLHSPVFGAVIGMGFFLLLHLYNYSRGRWRLPMLIGLLATPLACFYTLTRQAWLGLVMPMFLGPIFSRRQRVMLSVLVLAALTFVFVVDWETIADPEVVRERATDERTGEARIAVIAVAWTMFADKPLFGHGLGQWVSNWESYRRRAETIHFAGEEVLMDRARGTNSHNAFARFAVELGVLGLIPYLLIFWFIFQASLNLFRRSQPHGFFGREFVVAFWQLAIAFLICINFVDPSHHEFLPGFFFVMAAVVVRRAELSSGTASGTKVGGGLEDVSFGEKG